MQTNKDSPLPTTKSDPDSQTARPLARNNASGCNAAQSLHRSTGFEVGTADVPPCKPAHPFQTNPAGVVAEPQEVAVLIGHFSWDADLIAVEVVGLLPALL